MATKAAPKKIKTEGKVSPAVSEFVSTANLAAKYRPRKIEDLVGQETAKAHIRGIIQKKNVPKVMGFFGPSGVGKTTLARMMAEIVNGGPFNIEELNFGANRSIDEIRKLPSKMRVLPDRVGHLKFFIFDEAHQLLKDAASALLKDIEEPPAHCVVMLCTNEPEKLLGTLQNRCEKIHLDTVTEEDILTLLKRVAKKERIDFGKYEKKVFENIAVNANGVPREALQLLNGAHNVYLGCEGKGDKVAFQRTVASMGAELDTIAVKLLMCLYARNMTKLVQTLYDTKDYQSLMWKLFDLNGFLIQQASGVKTYYSKPRQLLAKHVDVEKIGLPRILEVHRSILGCREKMNTFMVSPEHVLMSGLSLLCKKGS